MAAYKRPIPSVVKKRVYLKPPFFYKRSRQVQSRILRPNLPISEDGDNQPEGYKQLNAVHTEDKRQLI